MSLPEGGAPGVTIVRAARGRRTGWSGTPTRPRRRGVDRWRVRLAGGVGPARWRAAPHVHTREDEAFYLLDGVLEVTAGEATMLVRPGDFVFLPRGPCTGSRTRASMPPAHCSGRRRVVSSASSPRPGRPHAGASRRRRSTRRGSAALPNCRCVTAPKSKPRRAFRRLNDFRRLK